MMHRFARAGLAAAATVLIAGGVPAAASESSGSPPAQAPAWGKNRAALRVYKRVKSDMPKCANRSSRALHRAAEDAREAMDALAESDYSPEDIEALSASIDAMMDTALAESMAALDLKAEKLMAAMQEAGASEAQLGKAEEVIDRARERLERKAASLGERLDERFEELFSTDDEAEDEGDCDGEHDDDAPPPSDPPAEPPAEG